MLIVDHFNSLHINSEERNAIMKALTLHPGDTIGLICPCDKAIQTKYSAYIDGLRRLGFTVKEGKNIYKTTYGYSASEQERADDFHDMVLDPQVKMILFGGGSVGNELLPYIDFDSIKTHPKLICSYSNGTTMLNTIYTQTGLPVYYGQFPGVFPNISCYDYNQFRSHFIDGPATHFEKNSQWTCVTPGTCEGILVGGYSTIAAMLLGNRYFSYDKEKDYILFLENHEKFVSPAEVGTHLAHIEQHEFINHIRGLLFGHFSDNPCPDLLNCLKRFGQRNHILVAACDDFGHGKNHGILPIGSHAALNTVEKTLIFHQDSSH